MPNLSQARLVLGEAARHGLAGEFLRIVEPESEADPAALLVQFLVAAGSAIGPGPYFGVEADQHRANLFALLVGKSAAGRKGTSFGRVRQVFALADPEWTKDCIQHGLSSGEGLIWHVRDPIVQVENGQEVVSDAGCSEKRLLVVEAEFASTLKVLGREGNTLSPVIRCAYDSGDLRTMTKNSPARATGAHVSIIGHVTRDELLRRLDSTEAVNGFANRLLFVGVRRARELPHGGAPSREALQVLADKLGAALLYARTIQEVRRDDAARALWESVYGRLTAERPPILGCVTARGAPHVVRLSLIFALLDRSDVIRTEHLRAALAVWSYCEESARLVFGGSLGDSTADEILELLRASENGLTRSEIHNHFARHRGAGIARALALLEENGLAYRTRIETAGRPAEVWHAKEATEAPGDIPSFASHADSGGRSRVDANAGADWGPL